MRKFVLGMVAGLVLAATMFVPLLLHERRERFDFGHFHGRIAGLYEAADLLRTSFGAYDAKAEDRLPYETVFSVKATDVVAVDVNGVRTVRVYR